jgi:hypothetical protein
VKQCCQLDEDISLYYADVLWHVKLLLLDIVDTVVARSRLLPEPWPRPLCVRSSRGHTAVLFIAGPLILDALAKYPNGASVKLAAEKELLTDDNRKKLVRAACSYLMDLADGRYAFNTFNCWC